MTLFDFAGEGLLQRDVHMPFSCMAKTSHITSFFVPDSLCKIPVMTAVAKHAVLHRSAKPSVARWRQACIKASHSTWKLSRLVHHGQALL